jgi:hypothetical protein
LLPQKKKKKSGNGLFCLRIDELRVTDSKIVAADGEDALRLDGLLLQGSAHDGQAEITRLKAETSQFGGELRGTIRFSGAWPVQVDGSWSVPDHGINELRGTVEAVGDFDKVAVKAAMTSPTKVMLKGQATDILNELHWRRRPAIFNFATLKWMCRWTAAYGLSRPPGR